MTLSMYALAVLGGVAVTVLVMQLLPATQESLLERRLGTLAAPTFDQLADLDAADLQKPLVERLLLPAVQAFGRTLMRGTPTQQLDALRLTILRAGSSQRAEMLLVLRVALLLVGAMIGIALATLLPLSMPLALIAPLLLAALGYLYPQSSLRGKVKKRKRELILALPGVLDLLTISMEAGLSFDMAISRVAEADESVLGQEFQKILNEIRLGRPRAEALEAMAERGDVEEMTAFVNAVVQAEPLGISVAQVLRIQSEELRRIRKQRAEAAGHRAPVLMLLPMMGCIFPCIFICLLGPAVLTILNNH